jgi:hypothetical protein
MIHKNDNSVDYSFFYRVKGNDYYYLLASVFLNYTYFLSLNYKLTCFRYLYIKNVGYLIERMTKYVYYPFLLEE